MPHLLTSDIWLEAFGHEAGHGAGSPHAHSLGTACALPRAPRTSQATTKGLLHPSLPAPQALNTPEQRARKFLETGRKPGEENPQERILNSFPQGKVLARQALPVGSGAELCPMALPAPQCCPGAFSSLLLLHSINPASTSPNFFLISRHLEGVILISAILLLTTAPN